MRDYTGLADGVYGYMQKIRRNVHQNPCQSDDEYETAKFIIEQLESLNIPYNNVGGNNVVGIIKGTTGKKIALRADIDALPVVEETGLSFASKNEGIMHACGHDFHVANLLGVAKVLVEHIKMLKGTVYLCFQAGEEISKGAREVISFLDSEGGVDGCFGLHVDPLSTVGVIQSKRGAIMSGSSLFSIEVDGKGGHGSTPWLSVDPIKPACEIALRIAALPATRFSAFEPVTVNPCAINSGSAGNIIPEQAVIKGNIRFFKKELKSLIIEEIRKTAEGIAESYGVKTSLTLSSDGTPPAINRDDAYDRLKETVQKRGFTFTSINEPWMASDNFAEYLHRYGGVYCFGGVAKEGERSYPLHNPKFNPNEQALRVFCEVFLAYTDSFLNS